MGCMIPIVAITVLLSLGTCVAVTGFLQNKQLAKITDSTPVEITLPSPSNYETEELNLKLETLNTAANSGTAAEIVLSATELNHLISKQPLLESLRGNTLIESIDSTALVAQKSQEIRKLGGGKRYLNGFFHFIPEESGTNEWQLMLQDIQVPGKEVPADFIGVFRELHMFRIDSSQKELQTVLSRVSAIELTDAGLRIVISDVD
tara:strand:- start:12999 stop:13613 length:615 start_codon:yes stop_codon:yes gene_type:complete